MVAKPAPKTRPQPARSSPAKAPVKPAVAAPAAHVPQPLPRWLETALAYKGLHEGTTLQANPKVLRFFAQCGHPEIRNDHTTPWCGAFMGAVMHENAIAPPANPLWALSWSQWGQKLAGPVVGAVGTKKRNGGGHVFLVVGFNATTVFALGGNQNDQVCVAPIARSAVNSYAWPPGVPLPLASGAGVQLADVASGARES